MYVCALFAPPPPSTPPMYHSLLLSRVRASLQCHIYPPGFSQVGLAVGNFGQPARDHVHGKGRRMGRSRSESSVFNNKTMREYSAMHLRGMDVAEAHLKRKSRGKSRRQHLSYTSAGHAISIFFILIN